MEYVVIAVVIAVVAVYIAVVALVIVVIAVVRAVIAVVSAVVIAVVHRYVWRRYCAAIAPPLRVIAPLLHRHCTDAHSSAMRTVRRLRTYCNN